MNLSPEAQAELEREMRNKIRIRKLRRKMAPYGISGFIIAGIVLGIIAFSFEGPLLGVGSHPLAMSLLVIAGGCLLSGVFLLILWAVGFYD